MSFPCAAKKSHYRMELIESEITNRVAVSFFSFHSYLASTDSDKGAEKIHMTPLTVECLKTTINYYIFCTQSEWMGKA